MANLVIQGPSRLNGALSVHGAKNSTLPLMAATFAMESACYITALSYRM